MRAPVVGREYLYLGQPVKVTRATPYTSRNLTTKKTTKGWEVAVETRFADTAVVDFSELAPAGEGGGKQGATP